MGGLGSVVGLLLGGALTEYLGWRWILFINVPIALAVLAGTLALVPGTRERGGIDLPGAITVTLALGFLVYAINRAGSDGLTDGLPLAFGAIALVLGGAFAAIQHSVRTPMFPATVPADRGRLGANLVMLLMGAGQLATFYFLTLYMQSIKDYSPMVTGLAYLPFAIGIGSGTIGPQLQARTSSRTVLAGGMAVAALVPPAGEAIGALMQALRHDLGRLKLERTSEPKRTAMLTAVMRHLEAKAIDDALERRRCSSRSWRSSRRAAAMWTWPRCGGPWRPRW